MSTGPSTMTTSRFASTFASARQAACEKSCTSTSSSNTTSVFVADICPDPHSPCMSFFAWPGNSLRIETRQRLWNAPSAGKAMSTISGKTSWSIGRNRRAVAVPIHRSSTGGGPTTVAG